MRKMLICIAGYITFMYVQSQTEAITIYANQQMDTNTAFMQGNGGASYNIPLTQMLKPSHRGLGWDISTYSFKLLIQ